LIRQLPGIEILEPVYAHVHACCMVRAVPGPPPRTQHVARST
jgi:hypothetical protein